MPWSSSNPEPSSPGRSNGSGSTGDAVLNEAHLRRLLRSYVDYYHRWPFHRALEMDAPDSRPVPPPELGAVTKIPEVGGLHHHYERVTA
jgi:putative transposase